jgi:prepilin peptidase CpaA
MNVDIAWIPVGVAFVAACVGAVTDVWKYCVYNALTFPLMATGLLYHGLFGGWPALTSSAFGMLFGLGVLIVPWLLGMVGAGDVKLMAGVGSWLGMPASLIAFVVASLAAGVLGVVFIVWRGNFRETLANFRLIFYRFVALKNYLASDDMVEEQARAKDSRFRVLPFGVTVPVGVIGTVLWLCLAG